MRVVSKVRRWLAVALLPAALASCLANAHAQNAARRIFELTNQDRQEHGLSALRWDAALATAAQAHADRMAHEPALSHQYPGEPEPMTRAASAGAHFQAIAENIAMGPNPQSIEKEWMHSTPHRTNILDPMMNAIGVAVVERGGYLYAVEDFDQSSEALTPAQVEQRVRELLRAQNVDPSAPAGPAEQACSMGHGIPQGSNARSIIRFETPDLTQLPAQVAQQIRGGDFRKAAVGACPPQPRQANFTTYNVAILFY
ncbi:MAG: CAP domain-containing protein [Acidobacteriaceae bacterium]